MAGLDIDMGRARLPRPVRIQLAGKTVDRWRRYLFTSVARDTRLLDRFCKGSLLDQGNVTLRQREIIIDRTCAQCGSEYEWGVHVAFFGKPSRLDQHMLRSLAHGAADDSCWSDEDRLLIRLCDQLHANSDIDDTLWAKLRENSIR